MKRLICLLLALLLPCAALAEYSMAGYDPENVYRNWESNLFFKRMEEKTGVKFTYRQYGKEDEWTAVKAAMTAGNDDLPDVLFKARLSPDECMDMLDRGVLVDLKPYLEQDCPNLYAILQAHPEYWDAITLPDGRIAALPAISEQPMQNSVWLNKSWMDTLKLSMPTTIDELTDVLRAFRDQDPNRNGKKDEIPLAFIGSFDLKFLGHAFGLIANDYNIRAVDGQVEFVPLNENFRPFIEWLRLLYTEGLIDKDGFATSDTLRQVTDSNKTNIYGGVITTMTTTFLPAAWSSQYAVMPPLAYNGKTVYRDFAGAVTTGTFAITTHCADVHALLQWVDQFYTEEVHILASAGEENTDYIVDPDGTWRMTAAAQNNTYFTSETLITSGTAVPGLSSDAFQRRYSDSTVRYISEQLDVVNASAQRPFPYYSLTKAQQEEIAPLQAAIGHLVDESIARWVLGEVEIADASFAQFGQDLNDAGLPAFMAFWQKILDGGNSK